MSKKKLLVLPLIVLVIFSVMGFSVLGAEESPTLNLFRVFENNGKGNEITNKFNGEQLLTDDGFSLSSVSGLKAELKKKNASISDFEFKYGADIIEKDPGATGGTTWRVYLGYTVPKDRLAILVHVDKNGKIDHRVFKGDGKVNNAYIDKINSASPFYLYVSNKKASAQTGDFVPAYVAMIAVALMSCGAIFAIRAKKASK